MTFGSTKGSMASVAKVNKKGADELVGQALDAGVNFLNTADVYSGGQSEQLLAGALGARRKDVVIAISFAKLTASPSARHSRQQRHRAAELLQANGPHAKFFLTASPQSCLMR
jgi:aryl-alcohol dehydrogenase-like predicted oxidoreductase